MQLKNHVYAVRNILSKGTASKDTSFSLRLIAHYLNVARALLTEQKADKYTYISEQSFQSLCVPLELGSFHNCCDYPGANCQVLKSVSPLPKFLNTRWGDFAKVMTLSGEVISKGSPTMNKYAAYTVSNNPPKASWFIHDNHLFVLNNKFLEVILLNSLFDNPTEITQLNCSNTGDVCEDWLDAEYPIDPDLISPMYQLTLQFFTTSFNLPKKDVENDVSDSQVV